MGYVNRDHRIINIRRPEKLRVRRLRRRAEKRLLRGESPGRQAIRATRRGWWYA